MKKIPIKNRKKILTIFLQVMIFMVMQNIRAEIHGPFTYTIQDSQITITKCDRNFDYVEIPDTIDGLPVTSICNRAFEKNNWLVSLQIPESVKSIGNRAFHLCIRLEKVTLPKKMTFIGEEAFSHCRSLIAVDWPSGLHVIPRLTFNECNRLQSTSIPKGVTHIQEGAFINCSLLEVTLPDTVVSIASNAFASNSLSSISFPPKIKFIGTSAFANNRSLSHVIIPKWLSDWQQLDSYGINPQQITVDYVPGVVYLALEKILKVTQEGEEMISRIIIKGSPHLKVLLQTKEGLDSTWNAWIELTLNHEGYASVIDDRGLPSVIYRSTTF